MSLSVVKVGGSLFEAPNFKNRLQRWLDAMPHARVVVVAGGGKYVDKVRRWQAQFGWTDAQAHERALDMLMITSRLMKRWLPAADWTNLPDQINSCTRRVVVVDCSGWARQLEDLPQNWKLTSDSLSAILAQQLSAMELVLLKSRLPATRDVEQDPDLVDPLFKNYAGMPVRIVNLRCPQFSEVLCSRPVRGCTVSG